MDFFFQLSFCFVCVFMLLLFALRLNNKTICFVCTTREDRNQSKEQKEKNMEKRIKFMNMIRIYLKMCSIHKVLMGN